MAELAAGIIGIVSFGVQLIDTAQKVSTFCEAIKDAPTDLKENVEEVMLIAEIMATITPPGEDRTLEATSLTASVMLCRTALARLTTLARDMERLLDRRHTGTIRLAIRKNDTEKISRRLERCKTLLLLAQQAHTTAQSQRQLDNMGYRIQELVTSRSDLTSLEAHSQPVDHGQAAIITQAVSSRVTKGQFRRKRTFSSAAITLHLAPPAFSSWLLTWACQLNLHRTACGFHPTLQCWRVVPDDDPVFRTCWRDDLLGLRRILALREANIYDRDQHGRTLFDTAVSYGSRSIAIFLKDHDAAVLGSVARQLTPLDCFWISTYNKEVINARQMDPQERTVLTRARQKFTNMLELLDLDILQLPRYGILLEPWPLPLKSMYNADKLDVLLYTLDSTMAGDTGHLLEEVLGSDALSDSIMSFEHPNGVSLVHILALAYATELAAKLCENGCNRSASPSLVRCLQECVEANAPLHLRGTRRDGIYYNTTPLSVFILSFRGRMSPYDNERLLDAALRAWVELLSTAGVDIMAYGKLEAATASQLNYWHTATRIQGISYSMCPEIWHFWYEQQGDHFAGMFWKYVEQPELVMPGSWVEEEDCDFDDVWTFFSGRHRSGCSS